MTRKTLQILIFIQVALFACVFSEDASHIYNQIQDITNPTNEDYLLIQNYLTSGDRPIIDRLKDYKPNMRNLKLIGNIPEEQPQSGIIAVNCGMDYLENCVITYSSFNKNYPRGMFRLVNTIAESDFKGHVLYRLGGWPNVEGGSLVLAHVPYAFKISFIKEVERLGYKRVFWLDTAILPHVSLNVIFKTIEEKGYFIMGNTHNIGPYMCKEAAEALGTSLEETFNIPSCSGGIFGVDLTSEIGKQIVDRFYTTAFDNDAYFSPRNEQNVLSVIAYQLGIKDFVSIKRLAHNKSQINADTLLLIEREFVNELSLKK